MKLWKSVWVLFICIVGMNFLGCGDQSVGTDVTLDSTYADVRVEYRDSFVYMSGGDTHTFCTPAGSWSLKVTINGETWFEELVTAGGSITLKEQDGHFILIN